ncbi:mannosyl-glycoprotein endo-beta-N-acetylglucosamidase, partial [Neobacillus vireti LMG 21834]
YKKGDVAKVAFVENGWAGILIKGRVCFVSADYLLQKHAVESQAKTMVVTASSLRVREAASTSSAILGSLKLNDHVAVTSTSNGWAQIQWGGKKAFVSATYLTNTAPANTKVESSKTNSTVYVIKSGDTFTKIGKTFGVTVSAIQALNPTVNPTKLKIGQTINIPTPNQITVTAQIGGVDPGGTFRFITPDGYTHMAKASGNMINELFTHQGKNVTLTLEGNRGQQMTLHSLQ